MTPPKDPWSDWPSRVDGIIYRAAVAIVCVWSVAVTAGCAGYICQSLWGV